MLIDVLEALKLRQPSNVGVAKRPAEEFYIAEDIPTARVR